MNFVDKFEALVKQLPPLPPPGPAIREGTYRRLGRYATESWRLLDPSRHLHCPEVIDCKTDPRGYYARVLFNVWRFHNEYLREMWP